MDDEHTECLIDRNDRHPTAIFSVKREIFIRIRQVRTSAGSNKNRIVEKKEKCESLIHVERMQTVSRSTWTIAKFARDSSAYKFKARRAVRIPSRSPSVQIP